MTDILEFIKLQRSKGLNDYEVLQATRKMTNDLQNNVTGGVRKMPKMVSKNKLPPSNKSAQSSSGIDKSDKIDALRKSAEARMNEFNSTQTQQIANDVANSPGTGEDVEDEQIAENSSSNNKINNIPPQPEKSKKSVQNFITLEKGTKLFHPSQDVKQFSDAMIFVELPKVLDKTKQRSFTMFFTPNMEYARRFSGLWSLNKRTVYVHEMVVDKPITGIQVMNAKNDSDRINNVNLAQGMCGSSEEGFINGMKISYPTNGNNDIDEYYICNPDLFFKHVNTWAQFSPTEWVKITNTEKITVPENKINATNDSTIDEISTGDSTNMNEATAKDVALAAMENDDNPEELIDENSISSPPENNPLPYEELDKEPNDIPTKTTGDHSVNKSDLEGDDPEG